MHRYILCRNRKKKKHSDPATTPLTSVFSITTFDLHHESSVIRLPYPTVHQARRLDLYHECNCARLVVVNISKTPFFLPR